MKLINDIFDERLRYLSMGEAAARKNYLSKRIRNAIDREKVKN